MHDFRVTFTWVGKDGVSHESFCDRCRQTAQSAIEAVRDFILSDDGVVSFTIHDAYVRAYISKRKVGWWSPITKDTRAKI